MCAVLLDTKGPEIRTGTLKGGGPVTYESGTEVTLTTDYAAEGDAKLIAIRRASCAHASSSARNLERSDFC
jgi:pyruvate kinase